MHLDGLEWQRGKWGWLARRVFELGAHLSARHADELIADAVEIQRVYRERYGRSGQFIPYGARLVDHISDSLLEPYGINPGSYYLLVTRFVPENNPLFVIREFLRAQTSRTLVVLGGNFYNSPYEREIREVKDPRVRFVGFIADPDALYAFYRHSYAYIHGHSVGGTNPTMLEALANSCCVLALDTPFSREMLSEGRYGLFWRRNDGSLRELLSKADADAGLVREFREVARSRIKGVYDWDSVASRYLEVLGSLSRERPPVLVRSVVDREDDANAGAEADAVEAVRE
jgi:glycosyltransferase involved in cell wall biosynthesis